MPLCPDSLAALRHIVYGDPKRLYSFQLTGPALERLSAAAEAFAAAQLERGLPDAGLLQEHPGVSGRGDADIAPYGRCWILIAFCIILTFLYETEQDMTEFVLGTYRLEVDAEAYPAVVRRLR